jgi:hypothetical protein
MGCELTMGDNVFEKLSLSKIELLSLNASQNDLVKELNKKRFQLRLFIDTELDLDAEEWLVYICTIDLSFEEIGPFGLSIRLKAWFKKNGQVDWDRAQRSLDELSQPVFAEASRLIANICNAMKIPPIVLSPREMVGISKRQ